MEMGAFLKGGHQLNWWKEICRDQGKHPICPIGTIRKVHIASYSDELGVLSAMHCAKIVGNPVLFKAKLLGSLALPLSAAPLPLVLAVLRPMVLLTQPATAL